MVGVESIIASGHYVLHGSGLARGWRCTGTTHRHGGIVSRSLLRCTFVVTCIAISSSAAFAQADSATRFIDTGTSTSPGAAYAAVAHRPGPTIVAPSFALATTDPFRAAAPSGTNAAAVIPRRAPFSRPAVLMITGGALLLTGLLVDGDASSILIIAGAGIGGYGLYLHLQSPDARPRR